MNEPVAPAVIASGPGSVAAGGSIIGSAIATGPGARAFVGNYVALKDACLDASSVFDRVGLSQFVGREWLEHEVDAFLKQSDRGLLLLEAAAGLGKTAFLAHLAHSRKWCHHFVEMAPGESGVAAGLQNLAAQLIRQWSVEPYVTDNVLPSTAARPEFLAELLKSVSRLRDAKTAAEPVVLVIDALDESFAPLAYNVMGLPKSLPPGVYLIVSQRPVPVTLVVDNVTPRILRLEAGEVRNLDDMRRFLVTVSTRASITAALQKNRRTPGEFVDTLLARGRGVWIYLQYVVTEIEHGNYDPLVLEELPFGVWQYYAEYWSRWRAGPQWPSTFLPVLASLAAAQEDVTADQLCTFARAADVTTIRGLLEERWRPFITIVSGANPQYRCYHASLREFLDGRVDLNELTTAQQTVTKELAAATRDAHVRIADCFLAEWGGLEADLPGLRPNTAEYPVESYGLRHVVAHLSAAGRARELKNLLTAEWREEIRNPIKRPGWRGVWDRVRRQERFWTETRFHNVWFTVKSGRGDLAGYLADVNRAWRATEQVSLGAVEAGEKAPSIILEARCALMHASARTFAGNLGPKLLAALVQKTLMPAPLAYAFAEQTPDASQRMPGLLHVAPALNEPQRTEAFRGAFGDLLAMTPHEIENALPRLPSQLPDWVGQEVLRTLSERFQNEEHTLARFLLLLAPHVADSVLPDYVATAGRLKYANVSALTGVFNRLPDAERDRIQTELEKDQWISSEDLARMLGFSHMLRPGLRSTLRARARRMLAKPYELHRLADALLGSADPDERPAVEAEILQLALRTEPRNAVRVIGPLLPRFTDGRALQSLREITAQTKDPALERDMRVYQLRLVARAEGFEAALQLADTLGPKDGSYYPDIYAAALMVLIEEFLVPQKARPEYRAEIFSRVMTVSSGEPRQRAFEAITPYLESAELERAFAVSRAIGDRYKAEHVLVDLAGYIAQFARDGNLLFLAQDVTWYPGRALALLACSLPAETRAAAVEFAEQLKGADRAEALIALAAAGGADADSEFHRALSIVGKLEPRDRVQVISRTLSQPKVFSALSDPVRNSLLQSFHSDLQSLVRSANTVYDVRECVSRVLPITTKDDWRKLLGIVATIPDPWTVGSMVTQFAGFEPCTPLRRLMRREQFAPPSQAAREATRRPRPNEKEIAAILELPDAFARVRQLLESIPQADDSSSWSPSLLVITALATAISMPETKRNEALRLIRPHLDVFNQRAIDEALDGKQLISGSQQVLADFVALLNAAGAGHEPERLSATSTTPVSVDSIVEHMATLNRPLEIAAMIELVAALPPEEGEQVIGKFLQLQPRQLYQILSALQHPPSSWLQQTIVGLLDKADVNEHRWQESIDACLSWIPQEVLINAVKKAGGAVPNERRLAWHREIAHRLESAAPTEAYMHWRELLATASRHQRETFYDALVAMAPLARHLGGDEAVRAIFSAVRQVAHWWP